MIRRLFLIASIVMCATVITASDEPHNGEDEKSWWQKRHDRPDIFYPHNAHMEAMEKEGDPCLLCHSFNRNRITNPEQLESLTAISNEPLEAICHNCHLENQKAPFRCDLCHNDKSAIWPSSHDHDYKTQHAEDARLDNGECRQCHLAMSFCSDCHFRRDSSRHREHRFGYRNMHGVDARMNAYSCGRCHNTSYCADCHRGGLQ